MLTITDDEISFLKENYLTMDILDISLKLGRSQGTVCRWMKRFNIVIPRDLINKRKTDPLRGRTLYTPDQDAFIRENIEFKTLSEIAFLIKKTKSSVKNRTIKLGIKSSYLGYVFKPCIVLLEKEIIRIRKTNTGLRKFIKIQNGYFKPYHNYIWEINHGPIPASHRVGFKDNDYLNCAPENLQLLPRQKYLESDKKIASDISGKKNPELRDEILKYPGLIELKRTQQQLNKSINDAKIS